MVPSPGPPHQRFAGDLEAVLRPLVKLRGLEVIRETSVFAARDEKNFRVPDLVVVAPDQLSRRGVERRAEIVIEILSPNDESRDKLPFYCACGVVETWLLDPVTRGCEVFSLADSYAMASRVSAVLGIELAVVSGPRLRMTWTDGTADI